MNDFLCHFRDLMLYYLSTSPSLYYLWREVTDGGRGSSSRCLCKSSVGSLIDVLNESVNGCDLRVKRNHSSGAEDGWWVEEMCGGKKITLAQNLGNINTALNYP